MSLIRFDQTDQRGPSAALWQGVVDWVRGSLATALGQRDFEDFAPYTGVDVGSGDLTGTFVAGTTGEAASLQTDRFGVVNITADAGTNAEIGLQRKIFYDLQNSPLTVFEARVEQLADADSPQLFAGFSQQDPDAVWASGALAVSSNQEAIGLRWNADETIDIVAVDDGTLTVLKDDIGVTLLRTDGPANIGLRIEKVTSSTYRLTPCVNGAIARAGAVNVAATLLPEDPMKPVVSSTVAANTAPSVDVDWILTADK